MNLEYCIRVSVSLCLASAAAAHGIGDLEGTWHVAGMSLPGQIVQNKNEDGIVVGLNGGQSFNVADGFMTIGPTGSIEGTVESTFTGSAIVSAEGDVTMGIQDNHGPMILQFAITTANDLMATSHGGGDFHELVLMAKAPTDASLADVVGSWWILSIDTPNSLGLHYSNGNVTNVDNANSFSQRRESLVIDETGRYSLNSGQEMGGVSVTADGVMTATPDAAGESALQLYLNHGKDVMIRAHASGGDQELVVLVKKHEVRHWESAGKWMMYGLELPGYLPVSNDGNGYVTNIGRLDSFRHQGGWIRFSLDASLNGVFESPFQGHTNSSADGTLPIFHGEPAPFTMALNAGGDFLVGVGNGNEDLEMIAAIRPVRPLDVAMSTDGGLKVVWVPAPGRFLQHAASLDAWLPVPGSEGMSSYVPSGETGGASHFYRLAEP